MGAGRQRKLEAQVEPLVSLGFEPGNTAPALGPEWLETDGGGAYASSSLLCANTRRYHGLLVAPVAGLGRHVFLSWCEEWVEDWIEEWAGDWFVSSEEAPERGSYASCAVFAGGGLWPAPLAEYRRGLASSFHYAVGGLRLTKEIFCLRGRRSVAMSYLANTRCRIQLRPFFACRHYHVLTRQNPEADLTPRTEGQWQIVQPYAGLPPVYLTSSAHFSPEPAWYLRFHYPREAERGFPAEEDLFTPGRFRLELAAGQKVWLVAGLERVSPAEAEAGYLAEIERRGRLISGRRGAGAALALAADQFVIESPRGPSVIAGYPWFEEWGRDLLVSLPGLFLVDGRLEEAAAALAAFGGYLKDGLLPNRLLEEGGEDYACADAPLWYLLACQRLSQAAGTLAAAAPLWPAVSGIIEGWRKGTGYGIGIGDDGLPVQGEAGLALTWMDAKVEGVPVTPRAGKAVELAALWHNGLLFASDLADHLGHKDEAAAWRQAAAQTKAGFESFWNEERGCCYDVLTNEGADDRVRANQLFAVGLPHPVLEGERAASLLAAVEQALLTPAGPRTLAPGEPGYAPQYAGGQSERDRAYHQGSVWPWLWGIYADACLRVRGEAAREPLRQAVTAALDQHLKEAGVGTVSELFGAEPPHAPGGCIAQAWSVAELRRVLALLEKV